MAAMPAVTLLGPPPTTELGAPGLSAYAGVVDGWEHVPELRFPLSAEVYDRMRRDGQIDSNLRALDLPIRQTGRRLSDKGVDERVRKFVADELGLDLDRDGAGRRRRRREGVVFGDVLRHALLARPFGFSAAEQVYTVAPPGPGQDTYGLPRLTAHLRKLGPRMQRSITRIDVARDGGLEAIRQLVPSARATGIIDEVIIPADRLVMFVNDREGADWTGRSVLRSSYPHWLLKGQLIRLGPLMVERNGMGIPVVTYDEAAGHSKDEALAIAKGVRAGEEAGAALPVGMTLSLVGVTGTVRDELPLLEYHDQAMGRAALAMFLNLGHAGGLGDSGLADTFLNLFLMAQNATLEDLEDTITEYVIRDLVELNYGPDEPYPRLMFDRLEEDSPATAEGLKALTDAGLLDGDDDLKAAIRRMYRLPKPDPNYVPPPPPAPPAPMGPPAPVVDQPVPDPSAGGLAGIAQRAAQVAQRAAELAAAHAPE